MPSVTDLLQHLAKSSYRHVDRAVAVLWWNHRKGEEPEWSASELADELETAGYAKQNVTRLRNQLNNDSRVVKSDDGFRVKLQALDRLDEEFEPYAGPTRPSPTSSVLPIELFFNTRGYLENVVEQANAAYDYALFDCCAVMLRRLAETLIIEVYEHQGREKEIQDGNGNYYFFSDLINHVENDENMNLSRNTIRGLKDFKTLGDLSAHNRRYNAVKDDIDRVRDGLRNAAQALLYKAGIKE